MKSRPERSQYDEYHQKCIPEEPLFTRHYCEFDTHLAGMITILEQKMKIADIS